VQMLEFPAVHGFAVCSDISNLGSNVMIDWVIAISRQFSG
jgi:hypothetical protein